MRSTLFQTARLALHALEAGAPDGVPVLFVHGLGPGASTWEAELQALPDGFRGVAVDLRGFGRSEALPVQAWRALDELVADVRAAVDHLGLGRHHLVGHGLGGAVIWRYLLRFAPDVRTVTQLAPLSPFGLGGSVDADGTPAHEDGRPSGAGLVSPGLVRALSQHDPGAGPGSPRALLDDLFGAPGRPAPEAWFPGLFSMVVDTDHFPGDAVPAAGFPGDAPGGRGLLNAISRVHFDATEVLGVRRKPPVLWVRGSEDPVVSDASTWDRAELGRRGVLSGWDGTPSQPMVAQLRRFLERWVESGGTCRQVCIEGAGHAPHVSHPEAVRRVMQAWWRTP